MIPKLALIVVLFLANTGFCANLDLILKPFVRVNRASGICLRSWEIEGKFYAFVLSAQHVTKGAKDQTKVPADFIRFDPYGKEISSIQLFGRVLESNEPRDYAILYYETPYLYPACASISYGNNLVIGEDVFATGAPNLQNYWVSKGIISSLLSKNLAHHIGHSAGIYFGSSGGPLFNKDGVLIGVNVRLSSGPESRRGEAITYLGFSVPLQEIYEHLGVTKRRNYFGL